MKAFTIWTAKYHLHPVCVFNTMYYKRLWRFRCSEYSFTSVYCGDTELAMFDSKGTAWVPTGNPLVDANSLGYTIKQEKGNKT